MSTPDDVWNEQTMAELVGLQLPETATDPEVEPVPSTTPEAEPAEAGPLLDPEDLDDSAGVGNHKNRGLSLAANPFTKLGVVATGTGLVIGILAVFTHSMMNGGDSQPVEETQADAPEAPAEAETPTAESDRGQLLTDLAMGRQQADLEVLAAETTAKPEPPTAAATPQFSPTPQPTPRPTQPVVQSAPAPPTRPAPTVQSQPVAPEPAVNPMEQWMALSHVGSYGRSAVATAPDEETTTPVPETTPSPHPVQLVQAEGSPSPLAINHIEEAAILQGRPIQSSVLMTGTQAKAVLETPLIWAAETEAEPFQFVVQLTEPLLTSAEAIGLPAETQLVVQMKSVDESGLVQLAVTSYIQGDQEIALPAGAIRLQGAEGNPLIAQKHDDPGRDIAAMDLNMAAMSGLSRAAELINRPQSSSVVTNAGGSTITQDAGDPDIFAGVLEGAFGALNEQMTERNEKALEAILNRPTIWYLAPGTEVEVYINQTIAL